MVAHDDRDDLNGPDGGGPPRRTSTLAIASLVLAMARPTVQFSTEYPSAVGFM